MKRADIEEGKVYYPQNEDEESIRDTHRRVIGIMADRVYYSNGGDKNYSVKIESFKRWAKRIPKENANVLDNRTINLRANVNLDMDDTKDGPTM